MKSPNEHSLTEKYAELEKELAQKSRKIEIQSALEKVRASAMAIQQPDDMPDVCRTICGQLELLGLQEIRNIQTAIIYESRGIYMNYEYYRLSDKTFITPVQYGHPVQADFVKRMLVEGAYHIVTLDGNELKDWFEYQKTTNQFIDTHLEEAGAVYYHWFSIGPVALGISLYKQISDDGIALFRRFLEVFRLAYRRYLDVEKAMAQAREARIETALERVRAVAMAMRKAEEVFGVCETTYNELIALGFTNLRNTQILVSKKETQTYLVCDYSAGHGMPMREAPPNAHPLMGEILTGIEKSNDALFQKQISGKEFEAWRKWRHNVHAEKDLRLDKITSLCFYFYSTGLGALGISSYDPITDDELDILKRFKKVFELAYTRYADVAKAEAQAREGQIQLALERVRARTMAMQQSNELADAASLLFNQIKELGLQAWSAGFDIWDDDDKFCTAYNAMGSGSIGEGHRLPMTEDPFFKTIYEAKKRGDDFLVFESGGESLAETYHYIKTLPGIGDFMRATENEGVALPKYQVTHCCFSSRWHLMFITTGHNPEAWDIYKRFAKVFDQTYTRFLDLQKAEEQTREAQIENALEKVRSRSLAMHKSDELREVVAVVFEKLNELGIAKGEWDSANVFILDETSKSSTLWLADATQAYPIGFNTPYFEHPIVDDFWAARENGLDYFAKVYTPAEKNSFFEWAYEHSDLKYLSDEIKQLTFSLNDFTRIIASQPNIVLGIQNWSGKLPSEKEGDILKRFAKVFEQAYIRFLDVKKAEEQAREAQIENALEKVRSCSLAMHKSDELHAVVTVLVAKLQELGIVLEAMAASIIIFKEGSKDLVQWVASDFVSSSSFSYTTPYFEHPITDAIWDAKENGTDFLARSFSVDEKNSYFKHFFEHSDQSRQSDEIKKVIFDSNYYGYAIAYGKNSAIAIISLSGNTLSEKETKVLKRFAKVFEQAYTRFLDLQKAEEQAREAQIEAALERVRSRAMAMHKTDELLDAAELLYKELTGLGISSMAVTYCIMDEKEGNGSYYSVNPVDGKVNPTPMMLSHTETAVMRWILASWKKKETSHLIELDEKATLKHQTYISDILRENLAKIKIPFSVGEFLAVSPKKAVIYTFNFAQGYVFIIGDARLTAEQEEMVLRFTKVFELTYRRFLDIKQAEEQAREAQIEASLERVRSRAMAMHSSEDLSQAVNVFFKELKALGITPIRCGVGQVDGKTQTTGLTTTTSLNQGESFEVTGRLKQAGHPVLEGIFTHWKSQLEYHPVLCGDDISAYYQITKSQVAFPEYSEEVTQYGNFFYFKEGFVFAWTEKELLEDDLRIFRRFTSVLSLTYRRYIDLKQAESQAREAQIEAALEKVRSRSLAMHNSGELNEVVKVVLEKLLELDINLKNASTSLITFSEENGEVNFWIQGPNETFAQVTVVPYCEHIIISSLWDAKNAGGYFFTKVVPFEEKNVYWNWAFKNTSNQFLPDDIKKMLLEFPLYAFSAAIAKKSGIYIVDVNGETLTEKDGEILLRFANVFDQAYIRFLDLEKAEGQAKESQIQLALERVRARTMAMQHSDELAETVFILFQQFKELGENPDQATIGIINEAEQMIEYWVTMHGSQSNRVYKFSIDEPDVTGKIYSAWKNHEKSLVIDLQGQALKDFSKYRESKGGAPYNKAEKQRIINVAFFSKGLINVQSTAVRSEESVKLLERFAAVFDGTYTRFLDLKQAEAQAREAQIELGLERVRARAMAMQNSNELAGLVATVLGELKKLDFALSWCLITIVDYDAWACRVWVANTQVDQLPQSFYLPFIDLPFQKAIMQAWKERKSKWVYELKGDDKKATDEYMFTKTDYQKLPEAAQASIRSPDPAFFSFSFSNFGGLQTEGAQPLSDANLEILSRFGRVFDLTYTRFNDLKQAEAQARESQIQLALERVRAKTAAMQHQDDLLDVIVLLSDQLVQLGFDLDAACFSNGLSDTDWDLWLYYKFAAPGKQVSRSTFPWADHPVFHAVKAANENFKKGIDLSVLVLNKADKDSYLDYLIDSDVVPGSDDEVVKALYGAVGYNWSAILLKETWVAVAKWNDTPFTDEQNAILRRFASAFGQTYTRYLDLQKAEEQSRESQIQLALERMRARSMAMQKSSELVELIQLTFEQFLFLGFSIDTIAFFTNFDDRSHVHWWLATPGQKYPVKILLPVIDNPILNNSFDAIDEGKDFYSDRVTFEKKNSFLQHLFKYYPPSSEERKHLILAAPGYARSAAIAKNIALGISNYSDISYTENENAILRRFTVAFDQSYTRFNDLQKAEAQAREAQIEASLERVRSKAMAMHKSKDLQTAVSTVFEELEKLNLGLLRCGIGIIDKEKRMGDIWTTVKSGDESLVQVSGNEPFDMHPLMEGTFNAWLAQTDFSYTLEGVDQAAYYQAVATTNFTLPQSQSALGEGNGLKQYYYTPTFKAGNLYAFKNTAFTDDAKRVIQRFASVLNLTFNRFLDLQRAEVQAVEAIKQASLHRVRAEIASMRTTADLERITPLIWNELTTLGVPFIRSGVFIVDETAELIHTYLSSPDGNALAAFDVPFGAEGLGREIVPAWRKKQVATVHWTKEEFAASTKNLVDQGALGSGEKLVTERPDTSLDLHLFPFLQGMLYVGNAVPLGADDMYLAQSLAEAFSTAYARYEDFNKLEAAKAQVENTLTELKSAQTQLVQKEKMASLGELTAGIAHEIQNPLNFVNNFSEVNREMLEELKAESKKPKAERDEQFEIELINDLINNEEKISHHGKRADSIVKGMLQHSRSSGGEKQLTDMNGLADEYFRLSYHGLRAKDKNFNAEMITRFDESLPKIEVVQQDIGRVFLNLFNNAFYAVNEKKKTAEPGYKPTVEVSTFTSQSADGGWGALVRDNGNGIPDSIKDKIMQPFFTTKPTGEGTGLGLSLSYDIVVKGHGGSINVDTKEGEFTEFTVLLPLQS